MHGPLKSYKDARAMPRSANNRRPTANLEPTSEPAKLQYVPALNMRFSIFLPNAIPLRASTAATVWCAFYIREFLVHESSAHRFMLSRDGSAAFLRVKLVNNK